MSTSTQLTLFGESKWTIEIKKHSALVSMDNTYISFQQRKAIDALICITKDHLKRNSNLRRFIVPLWIIRRLSRVRRNDNIWLKKALKGLVTLAIEYNILWKDKQAWGVFSFLSYVHIEGDRRGKTATVTFELSTPVLEAVKRPSMYVNLDLLVLRELADRKYAHPLYQFLKDYIKIKKKRVDLDDFRKIVGVPPTKYKIFTMLRKRVLDEAVRIINEKTPMTVSYRLIKKGRKIIAIDFYLSGSYKVLKKEDVNSELIEKLKNFGIKDKAISNLLKQHHEDYILGNIVAVENQLKKWSKIRNIPAYLMKAFEIDYRPVETEYTKIQEREEKELKTKIESEKKAQLELAILEWTYKEARNSNLEQAKMKLSNEEMKNLQEEFIESLHQNEFQSKAFNLKGFKHSIIQARWQKFLIERFLPWEYHDFESYKALHFKTEQSATS